MPELGSRQNMTGMETKRARGKCIANALVCQLCWTFLLPLTVVQPCNHSKLWVYQVLLQTLTPSLPPGNRSIMCVDNGTCPPLPRTFLLGEDTSTAIPHRMWRQFCKHQLAILWISSAVGNSGILLCSETNFIFYCTWGGFKKRWRLKTYMSPQVQRQIYRCTALEHAPYTCISLVPNCLQRHNHAADSNELYYSYLRGPKFCFESNTSLTYLPSTSARIVQKQLGGRVPYIGGRIETHVGYVVSGGDPPRSHCGRRQCPSPYFIFLISKRRIFVDC